MKYKTSCQTQLHDETEDIFCFGTLSDSTVLCIYFSLCYLFHFLELLVFLLTVAGCTLQTSPQIVSHSESCCSHLSCCIEIASSFFKEELLFAKIPLNLPGGLSDCLYSTDGVLGSLHQVLTLFSGICTCTQHSHPPAPPAPIFFLSFPTSISSFLPKALF